MFAKSMFFSLLLIAFAHFISLSEFAIAFLEAKERCNARVRHGSFDTSVLEIDQQDLKLFLDALSEGPEYS